MTTPVPRTWPPLVRLNGLRYVANMLSSAKDQSVLFVGQSEGWVIVPWTQLGP